MTAQVPAETAEPAVSGRREVVVGVATTVVLAVLGAPLGLLAAALTPHAQYAVYIGGGGLLYVSIYPDENPAAVGGDGVLVAVLAGAGLLAGLVAVLGRRRAPTGTVVGLLVGGLVAGLVAMAVAHAVVHGDHAGTGATDRQGIFTARPYVRGRVDFATLPAVALLVFLAANVRFLLATLPRQREARRVADQRRLLTGAGQGYPAPPGHPPPGYGYPPPGGPSEGPATRI